MGMNTSRTGRQRVRGKGGGGLLLRRFVFHDSIDCSKPVGPVTPIRPFAVVLPALFLRRVTTEAAACREETASPGEETCQAVRPSAASAYPAAPACQAEPACPEAQPYPAAPACRAEQACPEAQPCPEASAYPAVWASLCAWGCWAVQNGATCGHIRGAMPGGIGIPGMPGGGAMLGGVGLDGGAPAPRPIIIPLPAGGGPRPRCMGIALPAALPVFEKYEVEW